MNQGHKAIISIYAVDMYLLAKLLSYLLPYSFINYLVFVLVFVSVKIALDVIFSFTLLSIFQYPP